jgi:hypothetical protein
LVAGETVHPESLLLHQLPKRNEESSIIKSSFNLLILSDKCAFSHLDLAWIDGTLLAQMWHKRIIASPHLYGINDIGRDAY